MGKVSFSFFIYLNNWTKKSVIFPLNRFNFCYHIHAHHTTFVTITTKKRIVRFGYSSSLNVQYKRCVSVESEAQQQQQRWKSDVKFQNKIQKKEEVRLSYSHINRSHAQYTHREHTEHTNSHIMKLWWE